MQRTMAQVARIATARATARCGCSLTSCRGAAPVLAGSSASHIADVAQQVARELAKFEATGSIPVVRSIPGVPVHKHWLHAGAHVHDRRLCAASCSVHGAARVRVQPGWIFALVAQQEAAAVL